MTREEKYRLAKDKNTPVETLIELSKDDDVKIRGLVAANPNTPIEILIELSKDELYEVRRGVGINPNTPIETLIELFKNKEEHRESLKTVVAANPNTPIEILIELSKDERYEVRREVVSNPNTPIEILVELLIELSKDERYEVRREVAANPNTPIETLIELSKSPTHVVRKEVAKNPNTPIETLIKLSNDQDYEVEKQVALNPNTPIEILIKLSKAKYGSYSFEIRGGVAENPNTPIEILKELINDETPTVRNKVETNLKIRKTDLTELSKDDDVNIKRLIATNPNTPIETLIELSNDQDYEVRVIVARNPNTPIETLIELSKDKYKYNGFYGLDIRREVAKNPNTPIEIIENLIINGMSQILKDATLLDKLLNREDVNIDLVNRYLKLDIKDEQKIFSILLMEKLPSEYKKHFIKEYMIKENISYIEYSDDLNDSFKISTNNNNCKVSLNGKKILTFDFELKVEKPIITTKEEAIQLIKTSMYNEKYYSRSDYKKGEYLEFQKNASNPYKDLPEEFKNDLDVIIAALKIDKRDRTDIDESGWNEWEGYTCKTTSEYKSLNIYESLPDSIKNSKEFKDRIFYEFVLPSCGTNDYFRSIIKELYENKDSSIEIKTEICDRLTKKYNASLPSYEEQLADIISTNYENASIYGSDYRMSESDIIDYGYYDLKATFEEQYSHSIYFDDSLRNVIKEVEDYKELSNKMKTIEEKLSNNSETLINFFKEKNIDPKSEEAKKMKQTFNETQDNLINELSEVKEKMNEYTKEKEVLEKTFNDR